MNGGPSHIDTWDPKTGSTGGSHKAIKTRTPGLVVCEHLPGFSKHIHRFSLVRSVTHGITDHNAGAYYALTGRYPVENGKLVVAESPKNFPAPGAVLAKLRPSGGALPDFVQVAEVMSNNGHDVPGEFAGFLGAAYDPLVSGDPSLPGWQVPGMTPTPEVSLDRMTGRADLLKGLDRAAAHLGDRAEIDRMDVFRQKAFRIISSPEVRRAFDLNREPHAVRERYGVDRGSDREIEARKFGGLPHLGQSMLLARRLIEAGVRLVTVVTGRRIDQAWDTHRDHFPLLKKSLLPPFDLAMSALMEDLIGRGLLDETLVVVMGEFGRTPKLGYVTSGAGAAKNGRDHWPYCYTVMFAGGGVPAGKLIGSSDKIAAYPSLEPYKPEDITATLYALMGVPPDAEIHDIQGKPYSLTNGRVIEAMCG